MTLFCVQSDVVAEIAFRTAWEVSLQIVAGIEGDSTGFFQSVVLGSGPPFGGISLTLRDFFFCFCATDAEQKQIPT